MSVKFRVGFTIGADTLFELMSKMLPVENLHVQEIVESPPDVYLRPRPEPLLKPKRSTGAKADLTKGVNAVVMDVLRDGEAHQALELKKAVSAAGYAGTGIGSRLDKLKALGVVIRVGPGLYQLAPTHRASETAA